MALNKAVFKTRTITAVVFAVVMLTGLFWNFTSFLLLFLLIHFGAWYEWIKLLKQIRRNWMPVAPVGLLYISLPVLLIICLGFYLNWNAATAGTGSFETLSLHFSPLIPCGIIFSIWINDTMAYIVGSFIGKTPFSSISPKKTWEGTIGGAVLCMITIGLLGTYLPLAQSVAPLHWWVIAGICAVFGTSGDLLESKIKRMAGVKDSGSFMPGHGGFLDRFDSLLVAVPFVWLYLFLIHS